MKNRFNKNKEDLRKRAEDILEKIAEENKIEFPHEVKKVLHELQVYRVELEMQNDELQVTQQELEKSRNKLADLYDHAPVGYFSLNAKGDILMLNVTGGRILGYSRNFLIGKDITSFISKKDQEMFYLFLRSVFSSTRKQTIEIRVINKKDIPIFVQLEAVLSDTEENLVKQCRIAMLDITERKLAELQIREHEESLREAQEMANLGNWSIDVETGRIKASPQFYSIFGLRRSEKLEEKFLNSFIHPLDRERVQNLYKQIKLDGQPFSVEYRIVLRDGSEKWIYSSNKASVDQYTKIKRVSSFIQDISEQKAATHLYIEKSKLETANNFARTITHEIRNPLTTINLGLKMLQSETEKPGFENLHGYINTMERNVKRVDILITQLLYASRNSQSIFSDVYICDVLEEALEQAHDRIVLNQIEVIKDYHYNCLLSIDKENVKIAFLNLIINSLEAMLPKTGRLTIKTEQYRNSCDIIFRDNGAGIKPELLENIFKPYFTTKAEGMGLGLSNTKKIILDNKGTISVESEPGLGTSFIVTFPV